MKLQAMFLHERLALGLFAEDTKERILATVERRTRAFNAIIGRTSAFEDALTDFYNNARVPELGILVATHEEYSKRLVTLTQAFYFRRQRDGSIRMHGKLESDQSVRVIARLSSDHVVGSTGRSELSKKKRMTVIAYARAAEKEEELGGQAIELTVIFLGWVIDRNGGWGYPVVMDDRRETYPTQVDQFNLDLQSMAQAASYRHVISNIPEAEVKARFARILGEPYIQKDWGGEKSDLFTARITVDRLPMSAAFAFKGPGVKGLLTIDKMGKNADQALRLFREPADLLVVQYHGAVDSEVRNFLSVLSRHERKRFMVLDGLATAAILAANNQLNL